MLDLSYFIAQWRLGQFIRRSSLDPQKSDESASHAPFVPSRQLLSAFRAGLAPLQARARDLIGPDEGLVPDVAEVPDDVLGQLITSQTLRLIAVIAKHASYGERRELRLADTDGFVAPFDRLLSDRLAVAPKTYSALSSQLFQDLRFHLLLRRSVVVGDALLSWDQGGIVLKVPPAKPVEVASRRSRVVFG